MTQVSAKFLARDKLYKTERPYSILYYPHGDVPQTNIFNETINSISLRDIRPVKDELTLEKNGILIRDMATQMEYGQFAAPEAVQATYLPEVQAILQEALGTKNIAIIEYLVRRRDAMFPAIQDQEAAQPVASVHIDFSPKEIRGIIINRYGQDRAKQLLQLHYKMVNIWKPLFGPLRDWPLMFCQPSSVKLSDLEICDNVFFDHVEESISVYHRNTQKWIYLDSQLETEIIIFQTGDSKIGKCAGVPHCAFNENKIDMVRPRESIECRALVFYTAEDLSLEHMVDSRRHDPHSIYA